jgi:hypothetical protein
MSQQHFEAALRIMFGTWRDQHQIPIVTYKNAMAAAV